MTQRVNSTFLRRKAGICGGRTQITCTPAASASRSASITSGSEEKSSTTRTSSGRSTRLSACFSHGRSSSRSFFWHMNRRRGKRARASGRFDGLADSSFASRLFRDPFASLGVTRNAIAVPAGLGSTRCSPLGVAPNGGPEGFGAPTSSWKDAGLASAPLDSAALAAAAGAVLLLSFLIAAGLAGGGVALLVACWPRCAGGEGFPDPFAVPAGLGSTECSPLGVTRSSFAAAPPLGPSGAPLGVAPAASLAARFASLSIFCRSLSACLRLMMARSRSSRAEPGPLLGSCSNAERSEGVWPAAVRGVLRLRLWPALKMSGRDVAAASVFGSAMDPETCLDPFAPLGVTRDAIAAAPPLGPSGAPLGVAPHTEGQSASAAGAAAASSSLAAGVWTDGEEEELPSVRAGAGPTCLSEGECLARIGANAAALMAGLRKRDLAGRLKALAIVRGGSASKAKGFVSPRRAAYLPACLRHTCRDGQHNVRGPAVLNGLRRGVSLRVEHGGRWLEEGGHLGEHGGGA